MGDRVERDRARSRAAPGQDRRQDPTARRRISAELERIRIQNEQLADDQRALEARTREYRQLFDLAPAAYLVTDPSGVIHDANQAAVGLLNRPYPHLVGKPLALFVAADDRRAFREYLGRVRSDDQTELPLRLVPDRLPALDLRVSVTAARNPADRQAVRLYWLVREDLSHSDPDLL